MGALAPPGHAETGSGQGSSRLIGMLSTQAWGQWTMPAPSVTPALMIALTSSGEPIRRFSSQLVSQIVLLLSPMITRNISSVSFLGGGACRHGLLWFAVELSTASVGAQLLMASTAGSHDTTRHAMRPTVPTCWLHCP